MCLIKQPLFLVCLQQDISFPFLKSIAPDVIFNGASSGLLVGESDLKYNWSYAHKSNGQCVKPLNNHIVHIWSLDTLHALKLQSAIACIAHSYSMPLATAVCFIHH